MTRWGAPRASAMAPQLAAILLWLGGSVLGLRDIQLSVPEAVGIGASATLGCRWALDTGEALYTVKWYHGAQEFFRFVPKELPNTRVFSQTGISVDVSVQCLINSGSIASLLWSRVLDTGEAPYTVKWYHGAQEFFRFVPKELPNTRVFSQTGISVDVSRSGAQQVVLRGATRGLSGRYRCEVSADAPFFHTVYKSAYMRVVELPESVPKLQAQKSWYSAGDMLRANCTSPPADPPANLTWLLNGQEVKGLNIPVQEPYARPNPVITDASLEDANRIIFSPWDAISGFDETTDNVIDIPANIDGILAARESDVSADRKNKSTRLTPGPGQIANKLNISTEEEKSNKSSSFSQLVMRVKSVHFRKGRLNVTCVARVLSVWAASGVLLLDEERPQIAPVMGSRDSNTGRRWSAPRVVALTMLNCLLYTHWSIR